MEPARRASGVTRNERARARVTRRRRRGRTAVLGLLVALTALACAPAPTAGTVDVVGDSLTFQAIVWAPGYATDGLDPSAPAFEASFGLGWRIPQVQPWVAEEARHRRAEVVVIAIGTNDASDGWDSGDHLRFRQLLATPSPKACLVVIPMAVHPAQSPSMQLRMAAARDDEIAQAEARPRTVIESWQAVADSHPEYFKDDGIHVIDDLDAYNAREALYWNGVRRCRDLLAELEPTTTSESTTTPTTDITTTTEATTTTTTGPGPKPAA